MSKDRDWLDYTQLGLSAAQVYKLSELASDVSQLRDLAEANEKKAALQTHLRQTVMITEGIADSMEEDGGVETYPQNRWVGVHFTLEELKKHGVVPPTRFDSWEDRDRAQRLEQRLKQIAKKAWSLMDEAKRRDAERCWQYMVEEPELGRVLRLHSDAEELEADKKRLQEVEARIKAQVTATPHVITLRGMARLGLWFLGISIPGVLLAAWANAELIAWFFAILLLIGCAMFLLQFFVRLLTAERIIPKQIRALEKERAELQADIALFGNAGSMERMAQLAGDKVDPKVATENFGGETSADRLRKMYIERRDFVRGIFGKSYLAQQDVEDSADGESEAPK